MTRRNLHEMRERERISEQFLAKLRLHNEKRKQSGRAGRLHQHAAIAAPNGAQSGGHTRTES